MTHRLWTSFLVSAALLLGVPAAASVSSSTTTKVERTKVAVIIANNHGLAHEAQLRYAESDGRRVARALTDLGGYDAKNVHLLLGKSANEVAASLAALRLQLKQVPSPMVMLYYSGHSDGEALHMSGTRLPKDDVHAFLDGVDGGVRIALLDACKSGNMLRTKGMTPAPAFDIQVQQDPDVKGKIVITSSGDDEVAQESDVLQGSFFTHFFVTGLYGQADKNDDGRVTLEEAYRFAHFNTVQKTIAAQGGVQHPTYLFAVEGEGDIVLSTLAQASATLTLQASHAAADTMQRYFVLDDEKKIVLSEFILDENKRGQVRLPPGVYQVRKREASRLLATTVALTVGDTLEVSDDDMSEIDYQQALLEKGAVVEKLVEREVLPAWFPNDVQLRLGFGVQQGFFPDMKSQTEAAFGTRFAWTYGFIEPRVSVRGGTYGNDATQSLSLQGDVGLAVGPRLRLGQVAFSGGLQGGMTLMHSQSVACSSSTGFACKADPTSGVFQGAISTRAFGELGFYITGSLSIHLVAHGGLFIFNEHDPLGYALQHPVLGTQAFVAWTF